MKKEFLLALTSIIGSLNLAAAPTIASLGVKNAASYSYPGFPNGGIARGSLFVLFGTALGPDPIQYASSFPLPVTLAGTSISVTVSGTTNQCPMIYTSSGQLAAIMPSTIPAGTGTMTVTYNGTSNAAPITVVNSSPGIFAVNQQGTGPAVVQDANGRQNALNAAFNPGQTVVVWVTGLGPITGSDAGVPPSGNLPNVTVAATVGGKAAVVQYAGRSSNAGVDQVNITLPAGVTGCYVSLYLTASYSPGPAVTSNFGTIAIAASGSTCSDPSFPNLTTNGYRFGSVGLNRSSSNTTFGGQTIASTSDSASGIFFSYDATYLSSVGSFTFTDTTVGSCSVIQFNGGNVGTGTLPANLDAGPFLTLNGPKGAKQLPKTQGTYSASLAQQTSIPGVPPTPLYLDPGAYTIDNGSGGTDVGPFKLNLTVPATFTWTNADSITTIDRSQALPITWTGGDPNAQVIVSGSSIAGTSAFISFTCYAKDSDLQLTVPSAILSILPPSQLVSGVSISSLGVTTTASVTGTASGLDFLTGSVSFGSSKSVTYK